ncbi:hypothetical protein [Halobaculum sp. MBLA0143]|uniref:hypothetical protein n=1 Tax=Halobaculum sp. MBLA0143 TaxID=3079933 RepID=UPI00352688EC
MSSPERRRIKQFAVVSLIVGLFSLRAALLGPPYAVFSIRYCTETTGSLTVVWTADLTFDYAGGCGALFARHLYAVKYVTTTCGAIMTLYGAVMLFRHGLPGMNR